MRLSAPDPAVSLDMKAFKKRFQEEWRATERRFFKVERRQEYREPDDPSFQAFERGEYDKARQLVADRIREQESFYEPARERGVELVRLRIAELPLTPYLSEYELHSYRVSEEIGERIYVALADDHRSLLERLDPPDFVLFDERTVLVNRYDDAGEAEGAWLIDEPELVRAYATAGAELLEDSVRVEEFMASRALSA